MEVKLEVPFHKGAFGFWRGVDPSCTAKALDPENFRDLGPVDLTNVRTQSVYWGSTISDSVWSEESAADPELERGGWIRVTLPSRGDLERRLVRVNCSVTIVYPYPSGGFNTTVSNSIGGTIVSSVGNFDVTYQDLKTSVEFIVYPNYIALVNRVLRIYAITALVLTAIPVVIYIVVKMN